MILVTLGTQKQDFTRVLDKIENSNIKDEIVVQAGHTKYKSDKMKIVDFIDYQEMNKLIDKADIIITHGGTGSILMPLKKGKKVIACARLKKHGEHIDDHQEQIVSVFTDEGYIKELKEEDDIDKIIDETRKKFKPKKYKSNTDNFIKNIQKEIDSNEHASNKVLYFFILLTVLFMIMFIKYLDINEEQLPILQYHHIIPQVDIDTYFKDSDYPLSQEIFEEQMKYLYNNGYKTLTIEEFINWKRNKYKLPNKTVMITIDDGCTSLKEYIDPILKKYNFTAVAFIITERVEDITPSFDVSRVDYIGKDFLNKNDINLEFGSHSDGMHKLIDDSPIVKTFSKKDIFNDLDNSYDVVNSNIYSYPFSYFDNKLVEALKKSDFDYAMRGHNKKTYQNENDYLVSRIGDIGNMDVFKKIFETDEYNQTIIDRIKGIWVRIKY